jgi:hypothetical protein
MGARKSQVDGASASDTTAERLRVSSSSYPGEVSFPGSFTNKRDSAHDGELAKGSDPHEALLCNGDSRSIPYFEEKHNPVNHMMAMCSIEWQGSRNQNRCLPRKYNETTYCHDLALAHSWCIRPVGPLGHFSLPFGCM